MKRNKGFTLMELMIVMAIIIILTGAVIMKIGKGTDRASVTKAKAEMEAIASACRAFAADTGTWAYWDQGFDKPSDAGLIDKNNIKYLILPNGAWGSTGTWYDAAKAKWNGPYLDAVEWPKDPWGVRYYVVAYYSASGVYAIVSQGPDLAWQSGSTWYNGIANGDDIVTVIHRFK
jgi:prepilin-type N-terminal cleavage/methylation domain-containing protein